MAAAPEIARLAEAVVVVPAQSAAVEVPAPRLTLGALAGRLRMIAAAPERWWGLIRFDPGRSVKIMVEDQPSYAAWLMVLPPGDTGRSCNCEAVTMIAGEAIEGAAISACLRPGPIRVHGRRHWLRGQGAGYSVSLHARALVRHIGR
jgi:hypothetical protein